MFTANLIHSATTAVTDCATIFGGTDYGAFLSEVIGSIKKQQRIQRTAYGPIIIQMLAVLDRCQDDDISAFAAEICTKPGSDHASHQHHALLLIWMIKCGHTSTRCVHPVSCLKAGSNCCNIMALQSAATQMMHTLHFSFCWTEQ